MLIIVIIDTLEAEEAAMNLLANRRNTVVVPAKATTATAVTWPLIITIVATVTLMIGGLNCVECKLASELAGQTSNTATTSTATATLQQVNRLIDRVARQMAMITEAAAAAEDSNYHRISPRSVTSSQVRTIVLLKSILSLFKIIIFDPPMMVMRN